MREDDEERLDKLRDEGVKRFSHSEWSEAFKSYDKQMRASRKMDEPGTTAPEQEKSVKEIEAEKLESSLNVLGLTKEDIKRHFPTLAENFIYITRKQQKGLDVSNTEDREDAFFRLHFSAVLTFLESDEDFAKELITLWPEEYGKAIAVQNEYKKHQRR